MRRLVRRRRDEDGAIAVMVVFLSVVIFGAAAIAIDIGMLAMERQKLHDAVDSAAHAGAYAMPGDGASAIAAARSIAFANDPDLAWDFTQQNPKIRLWCVVASNGMTPPGVDTSQIPSTCKPGSAAPTVANYPDLRCNTVICKIPCSPSPSTSCNTVEVVAEKDVPFGFANIWGISEGSTGSVASAACKGSCGDDSPNPLDIVIMADRTPSMADSDRRAMVDGIRTMLTTMDPTMQYVAFGALHKSRKPGDSGYSSSCIAQNTLAPNDDYYNETLSKVGTWIPVPFSNNYLTASKTLNSSSNMARALQCVYDGNPDGKFGTHLASAMKAAGRYALGLDPNNLSSLPADRPGDVRKVVIFETDGQPDETYNGGTASLGAPGDVASRSSRQTACNNFEKIADDFKDEPNTILITIGFGGANTQTCSSGRYVRDLLARAASPSPAGGASVAKNCNTTANKTSVNSDGDFYFCATDGTEMAAIFQTALAQVQKGVKLVKLPN